jgi:hypothetical protein
MTVSAMPGVPRPPRTAAPRPPYAVEEVLALLGGTITRKTLLRWVRQGRFVRPLSCGHGRRLWFPRQAVDDLLAGRSPAE